MAETQAAQWLRENFSTKAFLQGLVIVFLLYLSLATWIFFNQDSSFEKLQRQLASQTVILEWPGEMPLADQEYPVTTIGEIPGDQARIPALPNGETLLAEETSMPQEKTDYGPVTMLESGLAEAPVAGLYEDTADGRLPVVREKDGLTPFRAYRRPFDHATAGSRPLIALAITGLGLSDVATESAIRSMPGEVSFIMSPYTASPDFWAREARAHGHEIWLTLPVEPENYPADDPGPHTMLIGAPERENQAKLSWLLGRMEGYAGFVTNYNPVFMAATNDMRPIAGNIFHRGLALVDGSKMPGTTIQAMAAGMKAPFGAVDLWIDHQNASQQNIATALEQLENIARDKGVAVGVIQALPVSYQQALEWFMTLPEKNIVLAPLSAVTGY